MCRLYATAQKDLDTSARLNPERAGSATRTHDVGVRAPIGRLIFCTYDLLGWWSLMAMIGGAYGARILSALNRAGTGGLSDGVPKVYQNRSKLEILLGADLWDRIRGRVVVDFGCGVGHDVVELAERGAAHVIAIDI